MPRPTASTTQAWLSSGQSSTFVFSSFIKLFSCSVVSEPIALCSTADVSSQLLSLLSQPNWQKHPSLRKLIPNITPSLFSSFLSQHPHLQPHIVYNFFNYLSLAPTFKPNVQAYASVLQMLVRNRYFRNAKKIRISMVKDCQNEEDAILALSILRQMNCDDGELSFPLSLRCYNMLLMSLARFKMITDMESVCRDMLDNKVSPNVYTYNTMINAYCKLGRVTEAEYYLSMIVQAGLVPDTHTYTSFVLGHCNRCDVDSAIKVFLAMPERGCQRNVITYNILIRGLCCAKRMDEGLSFFSQMGQDKCIPNERTYNQLISGFCAVKKVHKAMTLLHKMLEQKIYPNFVTYNLLVEGQCKEGDIDSALWVVNVMKESGIVPDQATYGPIVHAYCEEGNIKQARDLIEFLKEKGMKVNGVIYTTMIKGYFNVEDVDSALALFEMMLAEEDCQPNSYTYDVLIKGLCQAEKIPEGLKVLERMLDAKVKPTVASYSIIIDHMLKDCDFDNANRVFGDMIIQGHKPDICTYTSFLLSYFKRGMLKEVEDMMVEIMKEGIQLDLKAYTVLIDGYGRCGRLGCAFNTLKSMVDAGHEPSSHTISVLVKHLLQEKITSNNTNKKRVDLEANHDNVWEIMEYDTALELFEKMKEHGCGPNLNTYHALIFGLCNKYRLEEAWKLVYFMKEHGMSPNEDMSNKLLQCCCNKELYEEAIDLINVMLGLGFLPHLDCCQLLVCGLYDSGNVEKAKNIFCKILDCDYNYDEVALKVLINGMLKRDFVDGCSELVVLMEKNDCRLALQTHSILKQRILEQSHGLQGGNISTCCVGIG